MGGEVQATWRHKAQGGYLNQSKISLVKISLFGLRLYAHFVIFHKTIKTIIVVINIIIDY